MKAIAVLTLILLCFGGVSAFGQEGEDQEKAATPPALVWTMVAAVSAGVVALIALLGSIAGIIKRPFAAIRKDLDKRSDAIGEKLESVGEDLVAVRESVAELKGALPHVHARLTNLERR